MKEIKEIYTEMKTLINNMEDEDAISEVQEGYEVFDKNTKILLESQDVDDYLVKYETICASENGLLECFDLTTLDDLKSHIEENNTSLDELKIATVQASYVALENLVYEAEEEY